MIATHKYTSINQTKTVLGVGPVIMNSRTSSTADAFLIVATDKDWCDIVPLHEDRKVTIGRSGRNKIVIADDRASREHCVVRFRKGQWIVQDLNSMNGTSVNGDAVDRFAPLKPGDRLFVTSTEIRFTDQIDSDDGSESVDASFDVGASLDDSTIMLSQLNQETDLP